MVSTSLHEVESSPNDETDIADCNPATASSFYTTTTPSTTAPLETMNVRDSQSNPDPQSPRSSICETLIDHEMGHSPMKVSDTPHHDVPWPLVIIIYHVASAVLPIIAQGFWVAFHGYDPAEPFGATAAAGAVGGAVWMAGAFALAILSCCVLPIAFAEDAIAKLFPLWAFGALIAAPVIGVEVMRGVFHGHIVSPGFMAAGGILVCLGGVVVAFFAIFFKELCFPSTSSTGTELSEK